jgi:ribose transport system substrate-binding protein
VLGRIVGWSRVKPLVTVLALSALVAATTLAACGDDDDGGGSGGGGGSGDLKLGLSIPFLSTPFFVVMTDQVRSETDALGIDMLEPTNADQDAGQQITDVRTLIDQGATGLLAALVDAGAIGPALDYAESRDVPAVVVDDKPSQGKVFMTVRADNAGMGAQACEVMGKQLKGKGKVLSLQGNLATTNGRDRTDGFNECMADKYPDVQIIERPTKWQTPAAANQAQTVVTATPDLAGIYMQSDSVMLSAVLQVLERAGKDAKVGEPGHVTLVSIDGTPPALDAIRNNQLDASISQPLDLYSKYGVEYLQAAKEGKTFKPGPSEHGSEIVKDENGNLMDLLPSPTVTKENVDDKDLWGNDPAASQ